MTSAGAMNVPAFTGASMAGGPCGGQRGVEGQGDQARRERQSTAHTAVSTCRIGPGQQWVVVCPTCSPSDAMGGFMARRTKFTKHVSEKD